MEILEISMDHFGKFSGQRTKFHPGINIIYGDNETGKSTMGAFIRGMFYGIDKMRGRAAETDEYSLRAPWENGAYFAGSMRVQSGGKRYRIERNFEKKQKELRVVCETDGREETGESGMLSELLAGMDERAFSNTVFFGRTDARTDEALAAAVRAQMMNAGGGPRIDAAAALERLHEERKALEKEKKQKTAEKIERLQELNMKIEYAEQEMQEFAKREQDIRGQLKTLDAAADQMPENRQDLLPWEPDKEERTSGAGWKIGKIVMAVIAVAALAVGLILPQWQARVGAGAVILLSCLGVRIFGVRDQEQKEQRRERELEYRERRMQAMYDLQQERLRKQRAEAPKRQRLLADLEWNRSAVREKRALLEELRGQQEALQNDREDSNRLEQELSAVYLAIDTLHEVTAEMCQKYSGQLNNRVSQILSQITAGRYTGVFLDEHFQVRIHTPQKVLSVWQVSRGTMEQVYFALRMACAEFLDAQETLPLILDDAFAVYDDTRLEAALRWLYTSGRQVLLFTCHRREQQFMQKIVQ